MRQWIDVLRTWLRARVGTQADGDERGTILVEYALLVVLIGVACIVALTIIGRETNSMLSSLQIPG